MSIIDITNEYFAKASPGKGIIEHDTKTEEPDRLVTKLLYENFGGNIRTLEVEQIDKRHVKTPDALWNEKYWEYKSVMSKNAIEKRMKQAWEQHIENAERKGIVGNAVGIVFDISERKISMEDMMAYIEKELLKKAVFPCDLIIIDQNKVVKIIRKE